MLASTPRVLAALFCIAALACDDANAPRLAPLDPARARVNAELRIALVVDNPSGEPIELRVEAPALPSFERVTSLSTHPGGGTFTWLPLASHVGMHELSFVVAAPGSGEYDRQRVLVEILPAEDAAPVFVRPGAGGTFDLTVNPCVAFDIEVRDDDSDTVDIRARGPLPERAMLTDLGPKRARFDWCPTPDQVTSSERWTIQLAADDGDHPPVEHDYIAVLRGGPAREGCPGSSPVITLRSPLENERITSRTSFPVTVTVTDDRGLRDAPLLYYTTDEPDDLEAPDVTQLEQLTFHDEGGGTFSARIPSPGLGPGEEITIWYMVSATDNDDPGGSLCDHRTDTALIPFVAAYGDSEAEDEGTCRPCTASLECTSGLCAATASGGRCVEACSGDGVCGAGTCGATVTVEGAARAGCGPVAEVCGGGGSCVDDSREDDDTLQAATPYGGPIDDGRICPGDDDYFSFSVPSGERLTVVIDGFRHRDGDLDLSLLDPAGTILAASAGIADVERVSYCNGGDPTTLYARVHGYAGASNRYALHAELAPDPIGCCVDDPEEDDDTQATARELTFVDDVAHFEGIVCPADDDWVAIPMNGPGRIQALVTFDHAAGDIDLQLYDPAGTRIASSLGIGDDEFIDVSVSGGGTYALRIFGWGEGNPEGYLGEITRTVGAACGSTADCPLGTVCRSGSCGPAACTSSGDCPPDHSCPSALPPGAEAQCAAACTVNRDCRDREACKRFVSGRGCGATGSGANGASCTSSSDCGGQRTCLDWPGGYCARASCTTNDDCETGTWCIERGGVRACALSCVSLPCREAEGYRCEFLPTLGGTDRFVCVPR